jgi:hypothetical protein
MPRGALGGTAAATVGVKAIYLFTFVPISRLGAIGPHRHAGGCPPPVEYPVPAGKRNNFNG